MAPEACYRYLQAAQQTSPAVVVHLLLQQDPAQRAAMCPSSLALVRPAPEVTCLCSLALGLLLVGVSALRLALARATCYSQAVYQTKLTWLAVPFGCLPARTVVPWSS